MTEPRRVVIVGSGFAGLSAAYRMKRAGVSPLIVSSGVGASSMTSGAADVRPWTLEPRGAVSSEAREFARELGIFGEEGLVATYEGVVRRADAVGARVLSLTPLAGKRVGVASLRHAQFVPEQVAQRLNCSSWARETKTRFEVVSLPGVLSERELQQPLAALQGLFDEPEGMEKLVESVGRLRNEFQGLLIAPLLGTNSEPVDAHEVPIGETLSPPEGSFGARFETARLAFLQRLGLEERTDQVVRVVQEEDGVRVLLRGDAMSGEERHGATVWADAVVVASGGLVGHGVDFRSTSDAPVDLGAVLDPVMSPPLGARDGWDGARDGGQWVRPPHYRRAVRSGASPRIVIVGDARGESVARAPGGTVFGAIQSGIDAADQLSRAPQTAL